MKAVMLVKAYNEETKGRSRLPGCAEAGNCT